MLFRRLPPLMPAVIPSGGGGSRVRDTGWRRLRALRQSDPAETPTPATSTGSTPVPTLPQAEREYLWQVEHFGLLLGRVGFQPLTEALKQGDAGRVSALLAEDFRGEVPSHPRGTRTPPR